MRIVCLVPEAAEILAAMGHGGEHDVVAVTDRDGLRQAIEADPPDLIFARKKLNKISGLGL